MKQLELVAAIYSTFTNDEAYKKLGTINYEAIPNVKIKTSTKDQC